MWLNFFNIFSHFYLATTFLSENVTPETSELHKASWWETSLPSPYIEAKAGYFFFTSSQMRDVYKRGGLDVQLTGTFPLVPFLRIYSSLEYMEKNGYSLNGHQKTNFYALPISLGLQAAIKIYSPQALSYYFTIGPKYFFTWIHNHSSYISRHQNSNSCGGFINTGFLFTLYHNLNLDLFTEASYIRLHYSSSIPNSQGHTAQVGAVTFGLGLAYLF